MREGLGVRGRSHVAGGRPEGREAGWMRESGQSTVPVRLEDWRVGTDHLESLGELVEAGPSVLRGLGAQEGVHTASWPELTASQRTFAAAAGTVPPTAQAQLFCPLVP